MALEEHRGNKGWVVPLLIIIIFWASVAAALGGGALILRCDENERVLGGGNGWKSNKIQKIKIFLKMKEKGNEK